MWSYDFVQDRTHDGRIFRTLNVIDGFTKEALTIKVERKLNSTDVVDALTDLFILRGPPEFIRSPSRACKHAVPGSGQWRRIYCQEGKGLDRGCWRQNCIHNPRFTLGKWLLRKLQRPLP